MHGAALRWAQVAHRRGASPPASARAPAAGGPAVKRDSRLSRLLHLLLHLARHDGPATSEAFAEMLHTNPVVVRRMLAGLRERGYVRSEKGHGGGWTLARKLEDITLLDVHRALGEPSVFAVGLADDDAQCLVERAVNAALGDALREAEARLLARFGDVTLADLDRDFDQRFGAAECRPPSGERGRPGATAGRDANSRRGLPRSGRAR